LLGGIQMLSLLITRPRRLTRVQCAMVWVCSFSLVLVLANRFPQTTANKETSWVPSTPSHITAKVMVKDFFLLQPPPAARILLPHAISSPIKTREEHPLASIPLDNRLFTRPPPSA
jgi:hypothetical protein